MQQSQNKKDIFIKYLKDIYEQNPTLPITYDTIYKSLVTFNPKNNKTYETLSPTILVGIQVKLNNYFKNNSEVNIFSNGYFWIIENRNNKNDIEYKNALSRGIKIYIPVEAQDLYNVAVNLFTFILEKNILMEGKVSKDLRNDVLVCRVSSEKDALAIEDYINTHLNNYVSTSSNPFLLEKGKVGFAVDGKLSYNIVLSKLLASYFENKRMSGTLKNSSSSDFSKYLKKEMTVLTGIGKESRITKYALDTEDKYQDFIMVLSIISKNLDNDLTLEELFKYQKIEPNTNYSNLLSIPDESADVFLKIITILSIIYSKKKVHQIIMKYLETGQINIFTRQGDIRKLVSDNFTPEKMREVIKSLGWSALVSACKITREKYGYNQTVKAINELLIDEKLSYFTNENSDRSRLALIIPIKLLKELIDEKTKSDDPYIITNLIFHEIEVR